MTASTTYRVSQARFFVAGLDEIGCPIAWVAKDKARCYSRDEAEEVAQRLANYLRDYPTAGKKVAAGVRIHPTTGGITHWRPKL